MSVNALAAQGTELKLGSGSPVTYTKISEVSTFNGPGGAAAVIDVSDLDSTAKEKLMGLFDEGQLSFDINYIPSDTQHAALRTARAAKTLESFQLVFPDDTTWTFSAYVTGFSITGGVDAALKAAVALEISGDIDET